LFEPPLRIEGGKSDQAVHELFSGRVTGIMNKIKIAEEKINFKILLFSCLRIIVSKIVIPIEPKIMIPTDANNSNLIKAELT